MARAVPKAVRDAITVVNRLERMTLAGTLRWERGWGENYAYGHFQDAAFEGITVCFPLRDINELSEFCVYSEEATAGGTAVPFYTGQQHPLLETCMQKLAQNIEASFSRFFHPPITQKTLREAKKLLQNPENGVSNLLD